MISNVDFATASNHYQKNRVDNSLREWRSALTCVPCTTLVITITKVRLNKKSRVGQSCSCCSAGLSLFECEKRAVPIIH